MPSVINKPLYGKLLKRFGISQGQSPVLYMGDVVTPITDITELTKRSGGADTAATTATARTDTYTVPSGKRWVVQNIVGYRNNSAMISLYKKIGSTSYYLRRLASTEILWTGELTLNEGEQIIVDLETGSSGVLGSSIIYDEIDVS